MAREMVEVAQKCKMCGTEIGTFSVKKENLILASRNRVWCPKCEANVLEVRDIVGRLDSIQREAESYPVPSTPSGRPPA